MHVLILFLISVTAYATSRISNTFPRFQAANFGQMMDGKQLNGSVIKEIEVESESSCRLECVNEERCKSYNFGGKKNKSERWKCQISDSDRFERPARANFIENKNCRIALKEALWGFCSMLARTPSYCFCKKILWFCFTRSLKAIESRRVRFG